MTNQADITWSTISPPADATRVFEPQDDEREFAGTIRRVRDASIAIEGFQNIDGETFRSISAYPGHAIESMTADEARQLAAALIAAADEVGHLHNEDGPR